MEFKIDWKIKNFEHVPEKKGQLLSSSIFVIDTLHNSQWVLHLYPYGDNDGNGQYTALYLVRKSDDDYPEDIVLDCQLSFVDSRVPDPKKNNLASWKTSCHIFQKGGRCGSQGFLETGKLSSYMENGTLTVRCVLNCNQNDVDASTTGGCVAVSLIGTDKRSFDWIIEDFQDMEPGDKKVIPIKTASKDVQSMTMTLSMTSEKKIMVDISPLDRKIIKSAACLLRTRKYPDTFCGGSVVWSDEIKNEENWSFSLEDSKEELLEQQTNNSLHFECHFEFFLGIEFEKVEYTYYKPVVSQKNDDESCSIM